MYLTHTGDVSGGACPGRHEPWYSDVEFSGGFYHSESDEHGGIPK
jgi:hypothetical protein